MLRGSYAPLPNRRQVRHWEQVCIYLDAQPLHGALSLSARPTDLHQTLEAHDAVQAGAPL